MRTRVKFCGIKSEADLAAAVAAGADAVGFNLYSGSARGIDVETCAALLARVPPFVTTVGLLVNPSDAEAKAASALALDLLQFHGDETEAFCAAFGRPYIKVIRVATAADVTGSAFNFPSARGIMLDAKVDGEWGGTGERFDWGLACDLPLRVILAGGLNADNVGEAIRVARPWAVDVSSGIERNGEKGVKDKGKMQAFMAAVRRADGERDA